MLLAGMPRKVGALYELQVGVIGRNERQQAVQVWLLNRILVVVWGLISHECDELFSRCQVALSRNLADVRLQTGSSDICNLLNFCHLLPVPCYLFIHAPGEVIAAVHYGFLGALGLDDGWYRH